MVFFYISFTISTKTKVEFNERRVYQYSEILDWLNHLKDEYVLESFDYIDDNDNIHLNVAILSKIENLRYGTGIYTIK